MPQMPSIGPFSLSRLNPLEGISGIGDRNLVGGIFQLGGAPVTGTLDPGVYIFEFSSALMIRAETDGQPMPGVGFGTGNGQFQLSLDRLHPEHPPHGGGNHVPDAGSALPLLGMALGALDFIRHRILVGTGEEKARVAPLPRGKGASRIALPRTSTGLAGNATFWVAESLGFKDDFRQWEELLRIGD